MKPSFSFVHHEPTSSTRFASSSSSDGTCTTATTTRTQEITLDNGTMAQIISTVNRRNSKDEEQPRRRPPLLFVHGSFHAAWCWAEHYLPYFGRRGYDAYALSLRGTGGTFAGEGVTRVKIGEHVADLAACVDYVVASQADQEDEEQLPLPPVLVAHSFGGLAVMKYLEFLDDDPQALQRTLSGVALVCSVPPSGNGKMTLRFLKRSLRDSWKITAGLALKKCQTDAALCRELFFDGRSSGEEDSLLSDDDVARYQSYFLRDTVATIDLGDLAQRLPSTGPRGEASFGCSRLPPALVVGARDDFIVDAEGVRETAAYLFGNDDAVVIVDSPHDVMLGPKWRNGARVLYEWLEKDVVS